MLLKEIDKKKTITNVTAFLKNDFDNLRKMSRSDALIATGTPTDEDREVVSNLQHYSYKLFYSLCLKAIDSCSKEHARILKRIFIKGDKNFLVQMDLNLAVTTYGRHKKKAILEFADRLFEITSAGGPGGKHPIDLRIYGDSK